MALIGVRVVIALGDDLTDTSDPSRKMMQQIAGTFHEYEKAQLVAARDRKRAANGKCDGCKSHAELRPRMVAERSNCGGPRPKPAGAHCAQ
jgi:hypothetical protein